jgi:hypothetical protein
MKIKIKLVSALVLFGLMVVVLCAPAPSAFPFGSGHYDGNSYTVIIDSDNNADYNVFAVWHDRDSSGTPSGEELFRVQEDGKVGIGEPNPTNTLDVNGSVRVRDLIQDDTLNNIVVADANGVLHIRDVTTIGGGGGGGSAPQNWYDVTTGSPASSINSDIYTYGKVGIGSKNPVTTLDVNGGFAANIIRVNDDYAVTGSDYTILADASLKTVHIRLPKADEAPGQILNIKRIDGENENKVVITPFGSETIDGTKPLRLKSQLMTYTIQSDGSNWYIISSYGFMGKSHIKNKNR